MEAENIIAGHSALDLVASHIAGHDAVILAISFDTALPALCELLDIPVIGITKAAVDAAAAGGRKLGVVFFGEISRKLYSNLMRLHGVEPVGLIAVEIASVADYLAPEEKDLLVEDACSELAAQGAQTVVICGAAVVGMAARLQKRVEVPLYDGIQAVAACLEAIDATKTAPRPRSAPAGDAVGLSAELTALLRAGVAVL